MLAKETLHTVAPRTPWPTQGRGYTTFCRDFCRACTINVVSGENLSWLTSSNNEFIQIHLQKRIAQRYLPVCNWGLIPEPFDESTNYPGPFIFPYCKEIVLNTIQKYIVHHVIKQSFLRKCNLTIIQPKPF